MAQGSRFRFIWIKVGYISDASRPAIARTRHIHAVKVSHLGQRQQSRAAIRVKNQKANEEQARILLPFTDRNVGLRSGLVRGWAFFSGDKPPGADRVSLYAPGL
ncbi:hypothetical protein MPL3365_230212 [Mesorhizobium plurifarium]|uniref:Uncharacterized protein n=1 Tax=Mesorhizobium plurifarium TaxID=69974 RepID=A0A090G4C8_MESPL|nr:hypothetical protein MPL3365_230212 [Mesorhizobium plurifarium]